MTVPRFIVLQVEQMDCVKYVSENEVVWGRSDSVFNNFAKIEVEPAKTINQDYFHLRFCQTNKYWARGQGADSGSVVANSNNPEEDTSKPSCTLFQLNPAEYETFLFIKHVQSGGFLIGNGSGFPISVYDGECVSYPKFNWVNWDTLVKMPKRVAFKGDNGKYLMAVWTEGYPYLKFSSDDPNQEESGHEVTLLRDGSIRIKSIAYGKFWRRSPNWIWGDAVSDTEFFNLETHFWPVKIDDKTIALQAHVNKMFCKRLTTEGKTDCLNASASTTNQYAALEVKELVLERKIYGVKYSMKDARIYGVKPYLAGTATATNPGDGEASIAVEITYQDSSSHSYKSGFSITTGVKTTIEANVLGISKGAVEISYSVTGTFEWNTTTTTTKTIKVTGSVRVPPRTKATVHYVGSVGTCDVPFSYKQQDKSSTDGKVVVSDETGGTFIGVNYYDFDFEFAGMRPI